MREEFTDIIEFTPLFTPDKSLFTNRLRLQSEIGEFQLLIFSSGENKIEILFILCERSFRKTISPFSLRGYNLLSLKLVTRVKPLVKSVKCPTGGYRR